MSARERSAADAATSARRTLARLIVESAPATMDARLPLQVGTRAKASSPYAL